MSARFTQQEIGKVFVIAGIIAVTLGLLGYMGYSFVSALRQTSAAENTTNCAAVSSSRPGGDPSHCETTPSVPGDAAPQTH